jgi:mono/diheme cytochrome c family protein
MRRIILIAIFFSTLFSIIYSCKNASEIELTTYITNGKDLYKIHCQNCHGEKGIGLGDLYPPLTDSLFLKSTKAQLACIIKNGSNISMVINGKNYDSKMPSFPKMADIDLAQVIVYITNDFGNNQGMYSYEQVASDLTQCNN